MKPKISIIILHHNESDEFIHPTLESINNQKDVKFSKDIEIIMSNDCDEPIKPKSLDTFKNIKVNFIPSKVKNNIGMNCQNGLDNATGDYILFVDDDDTFFDENSLHWCLEAIDCTDGECDLIHFDNVQEMLINECEYKYFRVPNYDVYKSAKLYKRQFLLDNNIHFFSSLTYCEDTLLNLCVKLYEPKEIYVGRDIYIHRENKKSVTRFDFKDFCEKVCLDFFKGLDLISQRFQYVSEAQRDYMKMIFNNYTDSFIERVVVRVPNFSNPYKQMINYILDKNLK